MPSDRVWRCLHCKQRQAGPHSPCPNPHCTAREIAREAAWKRYDDD